MILTRNKLLIIFLILVFILGGLGFYQHHKKTQKLQTEWDSFTQEFDNCDFVFIDDEVFTKQFFLDNNPSFKVNTVEVKRMLFQHDKRIKTWRLKLGLNGNSYECFVCQRFPKDLVIYLGENAIRIRGAVFSSQ